MFRPYNIEEGKFLVKLARMAVEEYLRSGKIIQPPPDTPSRLLKDKYGVFTTIEVSWVRIGGVNLGVALVFRRRFITR